MLYKNLLAAQEHYEKLGFQITEAPWVVPRAISEITCPVPRKCYTLGDVGDLVGSGEQSFLHMIAEGQLDLGKFQCITPCFRPDEEDKWHQKGFMKLELIAQPGNPKELLDAALAFFEKHVICRVVEKGGHASIDRGPAWDIEGWSCEDNAWIELGSYGQRYHPLVGEWSYGTGCAEPRLSRVIGESS